MSEYNKDFGEPQLPPLDDLSIMESPSLDFNKTNLGLLLSSLCGTGECVLGLLFMIMLLYFVAIAAFVVNVIVDDGSCCNSY